MIQLFQQVELTTFGPSRYLPHAEPPLHRIQGSRSRTLRGLVRRDAPRGPGVYGMLDAHGGLVYVGKAKSLRARLLSYFRHRSRDPKAGHILSWTGSIVWEQCPSEFTALLRELELIRRWRPRLNVLGQPERQRFAYLCVGRAPAPYLFLANQPPRESVAVFGPIRSLRRYHEAVRLLNLRFGLRDCPSKQPMHFADHGLLFDESLRPGCLRLDLATCHAPCAGRCTAAQYDEAVQRALAHLRGGDAALLTQIEAEMASAAAELAYERAATLRDHLDSLRRLQFLLTRLREAQARPTFVYEQVGRSVQPVWQIIHGGRIILTANRPRTQAERRRVERRMREEIGQRAVDSPVQPNELNEVLLIAAWFRRHPEEWDKTWQVA